MITEEKIKNAAMDLNKVLGLDPQINLNQSAEDITELIRKVLALDLIEPTDIFNPETEEVLRDLKHLDNEEIQDELVIPEEPTEDDSLPSQVKNAHKIRALKDICNVNEEFKSIRGVLGQYQDMELLRDKMLEILTGKKIDVPLPEKESVKIIVKPLFQEACPKLTKQEYEDLERLIIKDGKVLQPLLLWNDCLVDGHNRYAIALKHNIPFTTENVVFNNEQEVVVWIKENAISQRNLPEFARYELVKDIEEILKEKGKKKMSMAGKGLKSDGPAVDIRKEMADKAGVSPAQLSKMKKVDKLADPETKEKLRTGKTKVGTVLKEIKEKEPKKEKVISDKEKLEIAAKELDKWVIRYSDDDLYAEYVNDVTDIAIRMRDALPF